MARVPFAATRTADFDLRVDIGRDRTALLAEWRSEAFTAAVLAFLATIGTVLLLWALLRRWQALEFAAAASLEREQAIVARREVEAALMQAQKMEAIGQLAGGIAHDFNNMLTVISGCLEMLRHRLGMVEPTVARCLDNAEEGVRRANALTARLLGFARKEQVRLVAIEVNAVIEGLAELLVRTLGNGVIVHTHLEQGLWNARGDASQMENAILNLCVNARDAMPNGGTVSIATANVVLVDHDSRAVDLAAGDYVEISVSDTGSGMAPSVAAKIFEPFFTTKGAGKGTGLGLSQVFVFARDAGGGVKVESAIGAGAVFRIYLPRCRGD